MVSAHKTGILVAAAWLGIVVAIGAAEYGVEQFDYRSAHEQREDSAERLRCYKEVDDEDAAKGKALAVTLNKSIVRRTEFPILSIPGMSDAGPGLHRMTVRMKMQGMLNTLGTGIRLSAGERMARTVYLSEFEEEDVYQEFSLDFEVRPPDIVTRSPDEFVEIAKSRLNLAEPVQAALKAALVARPNQPLVYDAAKTNVLPLSEGQIQTLNALGASPRRVDFRLNFPQNTTGQSSRDAVGERGISTPNSSLRRLTVDWVKVEKVADPATIVVREVNCQYAWRRPGETQRFRIWMHNRSGKDKTAQLRLSIKFGLDGRLVLGEKPVTIKDGAFQSMVWDWAIPANQYRYGHEVEAEIIEGGKAVAANRSWFAVHPKVTAVMIPANDSFTGLTGARFHDPYGTIPRVSNYDEFWAPTPYDSAGLVPEDPEKPYSRGNSGGYMTIAELAARVKHNESRGIFSAFYLEGHGTGCKAWDLYYDKPEQAVNVNIPTEEFYLKRRHALTNDYPRWVAEGKKDKEPPYPHVGFVMYNGLYREPVDRVIQGTIELCRLTGIGGIRWDSCLPFQAFNHDALGHSLGKKPEELAAVQRANFTRFRQEVRAKMPTFEWRMNGGLGSLMSKPEDPFDFAKARQLIEDDFHKVFVADDNGIQEEAWGHSYLGYADYKNVILNYLRATRYESAAYKYAGGHHAHMHSYNGGMHYTPDDFYKQALELLGGAHIDSMNYGPFPESDFDLGVYAARFGEFFWDPKLTQLEAIGDKVSVNTDEDLWYAEAGFEKDTDRGTHLYVLPVINPPVTERWLRNRFGQLPTPIRKPIGVSVKLPAGYTKVKGVYLLDYSPYPTVRNLEFKVSGGAVSYELPELLIFKVAAVEFQK